MSHIFLDLYIGIQYNDNAPMNTLNSINYTELIRNFFEAN